MYLLKSLVALTFLLPSTFSIPLSFKPDTVNLDGPSLEPRKTCLDTCGRVCYWSSTVAKAQTKGYDLLSSGDDINDYPHEYYNFEDLEFPINGPYYEYPILRSFDVYTGGSPGADRVIFNAYNEYGGLITHDGADGNEFVDCV